MHSIPQELFGGEITPFLMGYRSTRAQSITMHHGGREILQTKKIQNDTQTITHKSVYLFKV